MLLVILLFVGSAAGLAWVMGNQLVEVTSELPNYRQNIRGKLDAMRTPAKGALGRAAESVQELGKEFSSSDAAGPGASLPARTAKRGLPTQPNVPIPV